MWTLRKARTSLEADNVRVVDMVMSPADVEELDLTVDGVDRFYFGGPQEAGTDGGKVWGARVITSPALATRTAIMGDLKQAVAMFTDGSAKVDVDPRPRPTRTAPGSVVRSGPRWASSPPTRCASSTSSRSSVELGYTSPGRPIPESRFYLESRDNC